MTTLTLDSIIKKSAKLGELATQIDQDKSMKRDDAQLFNNRKIDDIEYNTFKTRAQELKANKEISDEEFNAIFGLEKTKTEKVNTDSLAYENSLKQIDQNKVKKVKQEEITELKNNISELRKVLYKGKYAEIMKNINTKLTLTEACVHFMCGCFTTTGAEILGLLFLDKLKVINSIAIGAGVVVAGGLMLNTHLHKKDLRKESREFKKQCEQEDPNTYSELQSAEKQLKQLQKRK